MFAGKGKHLQATFRKQVHPFIGIESGRIPRLLELVVGGSVFERHIQEGPRLSAPVPDGIDAPVETYAKLHVSKRLVGAGRGPVIFGDRLCFHIPFVFDDVRGKPMIEGS
jgi:hypothetical protein